MSLLRKAIEQRRQYYIDKLLAAGVYKTEVHLYEMTLTELEQVYASYCRCESRNGKAL